MEYPPPPTSASCADSNEGKGSRDCGGSGYVGVIHGVIRHEHPAASSCGRPIPAYATIGPERGSVIAPVTPPPETMWVLCPEWSGAWCYYNTVSGESSWAPPESGLQLTLEQRTLAPARLPDVTPPSLPPSLQLGTLHLSSDWVAPRFHT